MSEANLEQRMTYADFRQLCTTYCGGATSYDTSKLVNRCWNNKTFGNDMMGYRFKCQCVGSRENMRLESCGIPPYYDSTAQGGGSTKKVVDVWEKKATNGEDSTIKTPYDFFGTVCQKFCGDHDDYYVDRHNLRGFKLTFNTSNWRVLSNKKDKGGYLYNCRCKGNKEERLSVSYGL